MYAFCKQEANLELITTANSLVKISSIMLEWSRCIINMLLYENGEILTLVSIGVTLASSCHGNANVSIFLHIHIITYKYNIFTKMNTPVALYYQNNCLKCLNKILLTKYK